MSCIQTWHKINVIFMTTAHVTHSFIIKNIRNKNMTYLKASTLTKPTPETSFQQFVVKHYWLPAFCSFPKAEENPHQVTSPLAKPARLQRETTENVLTRPLLQWQVTEPEKSKCFIEKSQCQQVFPHAQFPWKPTCSVSSSAQSASSSPHSG